MWKIVVLTATCCLLVQGSVLAADWQEFEIDRLAIGGGFNGDSLHIEDGNPVITWNRKPEGGNVTIMQVEYSDGFSPAVAVASGDETWWGGTTLLVDGSEYLAIQRPGPDGYGYYLQGLSAGTSDLQWLAGLADSTFYEDFHVDETSVWLAYSGLHPDEELRSLRLHQLVPGEEPKTIIGPRAIWPSMTELNDDLYVGYHNMLNYGEDLGPSYGHFELAKVTGGELEVVYQDETRLHNGLRTQMEVDEESGIIWVSYVNPTRYTYPPAAPEDQQTEIRLYEIILTRWDGKTATQNSVTIGPGRMYYDLLLIDGTPHVYYVDQPQATVFDSWIGEGYMELDTVRSYRQGGWIPAAEPRAVLGADGTVVLTLKAVEFASGDGGLLAMVRSGE